MATKKQNRRHVVRRLRRVLNGNFDAIGTKLSGYRANRHHYGAGIGRQHRVTAE